MDSSATRTDNQLAWRRDRIVSPRPPDPWIAATGRPLAVGGTWTVYGVDAPDVPVREPGRVALHDTGPQHSLCRPNERLRSLSGPLPPPPPPPLRLRRL